jgi:hypothetical protein
MCGSCCNCECCSECCSDHALAERACFNCGTVNCWRRFHKVHWWLIYLSLALEVIAAVILNLVSWQTGLFLFVLMSAGLISFCVAYCCRGFYADDELGIVIRRNELTTVRWMLRKGELARPQNALVSLNDTKDLDMMRLLIDGGVDVNEPGSSIYTPLHSVALRDNLPMARLLIERGANVNDRFHQGPSIFCAVSVPMAQLLIEAGADITDEGQLLIEHAASSQDATFVEYLIQAVRDKGTPFTRVFLNYASSPAIARILIAQLDSDVDAGNPPALTVASLHGYTNLMRFLVVCGAAVDKEMLVRRAGGIVVRCSALNLCKSNEAAALLLAAGAQKQKGECDFEPTADEIAEARRRIARERVDLIRARAFEVCVALESLELPALVMCEILEFACAPFAACVPFHHKWDIVVAVKHHEPFAQWSSARSRSSSTSGVEIV